MKTSSFLRLLLPLAFALTILPARAQGGGARPAWVPPPDGCFLKVETTAYHESEADHLIYGDRSAVGTTLRQGRVRSAAADWSVFPAGTLFEVMSVRQIYIVDDYGRALAGKMRLDLHVPSGPAIKEWGNRKEVVRIIRWGSFRYSTDFLARVARSLGEKGRLGEFPHISGMLRRLEARQRLASRF